MNIIHFINALHLHILAAKINSIKKITNQTLIHSIRIFSLNTILI